MRILALLFAAACYAGGLYLVAHSDSMVSDHIMGGSNLSQTLHSHGGKIANLGLALMLAVVLDWVYLRFLNIRKEFSTYYVDRWPWVIGWFAVLVAVILGVTIGQA